MIPADQGGTGAKNGSAVSRRPEVDDLADDVEVGVVVYDADTAVRGDRGY